MQRLYVVLLIALAFFPSVSFGCSCLATRGGVEGIKLAFLNADVVVQAEVIETSQRTIDSKTYGRAEQQIAKWKVNRSWKGENQPGSNLETRTTVTCCLCGTSVKKGDIYLLYLSGQIPYELWSCGSNKPFDKAKEEVEVINSYLAEMRGT